MQTYYLYVFMDDLHSLIIIHQSVCTRFYCLHKAYSETKSYMFLMQALVLRVGSNREASHSKKSYFKSQNKQVIMSLKCKYRVRWFSSKGAFLVLLWTVLIFIVCTSYDSYGELVNNKNYSFSLKWLFIVLKVKVVALVALFFVSAPLSGWLADAKFGNYKIFRVGAVLLFIARVINCLLLILEELVWESDVLKEIQLYLGVCFLVVDYCACFVTGLPLGLDQMPDASSSKITSYIAWFVWSLFAGCFLGGTFEILKEYCIAEAMHSNYILIWELLLILCMSIVLVSIFLFSPKWLIIEPKSPQSLKTIYQVLKFAAKHKVPLNRSAFTYWEQDIPSRIDLGKSKYGGPFTTEQVEDVKTVLRLLAISVPIMFQFFCLTLLGETIGKIGHIPGLNVCTTEVVHQFTNSIFWYGCLATFVYEFLIYPFVRNRLPSILKRIGGLSLLATLVIFVCFILKLVRYLTHSSETVTEWIAHILHQSTTGVLSLLLMNLILQFISAQSPYNMRGLLLSLVVVLFIVLGGIQAIFSHCYHNNYYIILTICYLDFLVFLPCFNNIL